MAGDASSSAPGMGTIRLRRPDVTISLASILRIAIGRTMKQKFLVFVDCEPGATYQVVEQIFEQHKGLVAATYSVSGKYDLLLRVEFNAGQDFGQRLSEVVKGTRGIRHTYTCIGYPIWDPSDVSCFMDDFSAEEESEGGFEDSSVNQEVQHFLIFVSAELGRAYDVGQQIAVKKKLIVTDVNAVSGEWDLLLFAQVPSNKDMGRELAQLLHDIDGIERTETIVAYRMFN